MRGAIKKALNFRKTEDVSFDEQLAGLSRDTENCPRHVFGDHKNCENYFCTEPKPNEENFISEMDECGLLGD